MDKGLQTDNGYSHSLLDIYGFSAIGTQQRRFTDMSSEGRAGKGVSEGRSEGRAAKGVRDILPKSFHCGD